MLAELARDVGHASAEKIAFLVGLFGVVALVCAWRAWRSLHSARTIEDIPTAKARSAPQGYVELQGVGRLMDGPPIVAPLSGVPCTWYRFRIEERRTYYDKGRRRTQWVTIREGVSDQMFWFEDDTGRVAVDPEGAEVTPQFKQVWYSNSAGMTDVPAFIADFLVSHVGASPYRFTEERMHDREVLYALGELTAAGGYAAGESVDAEVRDVLREWKQDQATLRQRFDLDRDDKISEQEWRLARRQARREVERARTEETLRTAEPVNILHATGEHVRPFLLSAFRQDALTRRYRRDSVTCLGVFFLLGSAALWLYNTRFGG